MKLITPLSLPDQQDGVGVAVEVQAAERVGQQQREGAAEERHPGEHHQPVRGEEQEVQRLRRRRSGWRQ